jgi:hypothetical protein
LFFSSGDLGPVNLDGACPPIGFNRRMGLGRGRIVDVDHCLIASDPINRELKVARAKVAAVFEGWDRVRVRKNYNYNFRLTNNNNNNNNNNNTARRPTAPAPTCCCARPRTAP